MSNEIISCEQGSLCLNSIETKSAAHARCVQCRFCPSNADYPQLPNLWKPIDGGSKHPGAILEKKLKEETRRQQALLRKKSRDMSKVAILKRAGRAEKITERSFVKATKNSGRSNKDGDHTAVGQVTLDTKLQTGRENPVVLLSELAKVRLDAGRAGNWLGVLVLRNKHGQGVVALHEEDFARLIKLLE